MYEQPKFLPDQQNHYFPGTQVDRVPVAHTVPRGPVDDGSPLYTGQDHEVFVATFPMEVTSQMLVRGREDFDINCSVCHGRDGYGEGIVVQRGFPSPPSFHSDRLRNAPIGHIFEVITNGYGEMYPFGSRIQPADRWAIAAYVRALQFSQHAPSAQLEPQDQKQLEGSK